MKKPLFVFVLALLTFTLLVGCNPMDPTPTNHNPIISATTPSNQTAVGVEPGKNVTFTVQATDPDNDPITYTWSASNGTPTTATTSSFTWTAPNQQGNATISVVVKDSKGAATTANWTVAVGTQVISDVVKVTEDITTPTTWESGKIYFVDSSDLDINTTLTIQPGAIIKFGEDGMITVSNGGVIKAQGTSASPIIFTSIRDDIGGDTNGDGQSTGEAGDWSGIYISSVAGHIFDYCKFFYAGQGGDCALGLDTISASITNCTFAYNDSSQYAALWAPNAPAGTKIQNNTFYGNTIPLLVNVTYSIDDSNTFHNPSNSTEINKQNGIFVTPFSDIKNQVTWAETEVPFVVKFNSISDTGSLTISNGVVVKFLAQGGLDSSGTLNATGVTFTSIKDDLKGDTDADSTVTPTAGDWEGLWLGSNSDATFKQCTFLYGGGDNNPTVDVNSALVTIEGCTFTKNESYALYAAGATYNSKIISNTFYDNVKPLTIPINLSLDNSNTFSFSGKDNAFNAVFVYGNPIEKTTLWSETEVAYVCDYFSINADVSLTLADQVVLKMYKNAEIDVEGSFTLGQNCIVTAYSDDAYKGDTNNDGSATAPYAGYWVGVYNDVSSSWVKSTKFLWSEESSL